MNGYFYLAVGLAVLGFLACRAGRIPAPPSSPTTSGYEPVGYAGLTLVA